VQVVTSLVTGELPSTKAASAALAAIREHAKVLVVVEREDEATWKSLRNVDRAHLLVADQLNTYDVLCADSVLFTEAALASFLAGPVKGRGAKAVASSSEPESKEAAK
jgi:large subunit ribosomal protein L4